MKRRDFLKLLGWGPWAVVVGVGAASLRPRAPFTSRKLACTEMHEKDIPYLTSDTAWFLDERSMKAYEDRIGPWSVKQSDGSYVTVTTRPWEPRGRDRYGANQPKPPDDVL